MRQKFGVDEHIEKVGWEHCCISEVTVAELLFGAERSNNVERNLQLVTDFCQDIKAFPSDKEAKSFAATFVTENKKHLERIPNIEIENWVHRG